MVWPASMLAKRRTERLIGRVRNEITSIGTSRISRYQGACGTNSFRKPMPCFMKPTTITSRITSEARAKVTAIWLVTVKLPGTMPKKLLNSTKMKRVKTKGKIFEPVFAGRRMDHVGDEFVGQLPPWTGRASAPAGPA